MWIKSKIGVKLALIIILVNFGALLMLSLLFYEQFEKALEERILLQLSSIKILKHRQIEGYLEEKKTFFEEIPVNEVNGDIFSRTLPEGDTLIIRNKGEHFSFKNIRAGSGIPPEVADGIYVVDLSAYNPDKKLLAAFIKNAGYGKEMVLITPLRKMQEIVLERTGMGETGETYVVGDDFRMRTISRFFPHENPLNILVRTVGTEESLRGYTGTGLFKDYRGVKVFSSYQPLKFYDLNWAILSEMDELEVLIPLAAIKRNLILIGIVIFFIMLMLTFFLSQAIVRPIVKMKDILNQMASGKIVPIIWKAKPTDDEIGQMIQALQKHIEALRQVAAFAGLIGSQHFDAEYKLLSDKDVLGASLIQMRDKLREYKTKEEVYRREKEKALWQGQEKERSRLSKELHDGLGPLLTTLKLTISGINMDAHDKEKLKKLLDETITEVRHMAYNLMPQALLDFGVGNALGNLIELVKKLTPISIHYSNAVKPNSLIPEEINIGIYRIAQEAINNAIKYSGASELKVSLTEFDEYVSLYVKDNGVGFDKNNVQGGTGIMNMKERARSLNGTFTIDTSDSGTAIEVEIPLPVYMSI